MKSTLSALFVWAVISVAAPASAGIFGVPTGLAADGQRLVGSLNPPGYLALDGTNTTSATGDVSHQMRFFIEVTGTTLDIKVFDPGTGTIGANGILDSNTLAVSLNTRFRLYDPTETILNINGGAVEGGDLNQGFDAVAGTITEGRLVRFGCNNGGAPTFFAANAGIVWGAGAGGCAALQPGRYIFEITEGLGAAVNVFGVQITDAAGVPYNSYSEGTADDTIAAVAATDNSLVYGRPAAGASNGIAAAMVVYPYVNRGCTAEAHNFDSDSSGTISTLDALGVSTSLAVSGNDAVATTTIPIEATTGANYSINNYGVFTQTQTLAGAGSNFVDVRYADWQGSVPGVPATHPLLPVSPIRTYLPNGYAACTAAGCTMTAPSKPVLSQSAVISSGNNPPVVGLGQTTTFLVSTSLFNPTASPLTNPSITIAYDPTPSVGGSAAFVAGSDFCAIDGTPSACSFVGGAAGGYDFRTGAFIGAIPAGGVFTYQYEVIVSDITALGSFELTAPLSAVDPVTEGSYVPAFSSLGFPTTEDMGPLCPVRSDTTTQVLTQARLRGVSVDGSGVSFAVTSQRSTRSFTLFGISGSLRVPLGSVVALTPDSASPLLYRLRAKASMYSAIEIEETEVGGRMRNAGVFAVSDATGAARMQRFKERLTAAGARARTTEGGEVISLGGLATGRFASAIEAPGRRSALQAQRVARRGRLGVDGLKLIVAGPGLVRTSRRELLEGGLPASVPTSRVRLFASGRPVPFEVTGAGGPDEALLFEASRIETRYTRENAYVVIWNRVDPKPPSAGFTLEGPALDPGFLRVEKAAVYLASAPQGSDPWLWDALVAGAGQWPYAQDASAGLFDLPALNQLLLPREVEVRLHFVGRSANRHSVAASVNGVPIGTLGFTGSVEATLFGRVPREALRATDNLLTLDYAADATSEDLAVIYLDCLDLNVPTTQAVTTVDRIEPYSESIPRGEVDYLIVTHGDFMAEAQQIGEMKRAAGLRTAVVDVERAYDRFSGGVREASAIKELIRSVRGVRYVLIVGDDTVDYKNALGSSGFPVVPSMYAFDHESGRVPSENAFADLDGDLAPEVAMGRLPVQSVTQARDMVQKIARQDQALLEGAGRHLFVTDNQGPQDPAFRAHADQMAALLPPQIATTFADLSFGLGPAQSAISASLSSGVAFTSFFGHGGPEIWTDEGLLSVDDVPSFAGLKETITLMWACEAQDYTYFFGESLGEALLLLPQGGSLAGIGPAGISATDGQRILYGEFYRQLASNQRRPLTLGEALRRAKVRAAASTQHAKDALVGFNLIGDPAIRVR